MRSSVPILNPEMNLGQDFAGQVPINPDEEFINKRIPSQTQPIFNPEQSSGSQQIVVGPPGPPGATGAPGVNGADGADGVDGADGRPVELNKSATHIQWRYVGDAEWIDIVPLAELKGATGATGATGAPGSTGLTGPQGIPGIQGPEGQPGAQGLPGANGVDSVSFSSFRIVIPAGVSVTDRCASMTPGVEYPDTWLLEVSSNSSDLKITHDTIGKQLAFVSIFEITSNITMLLIGTAAYTGVKNLSSTTAEINGFCTIQKQLILNLVFI